jgi:hypothetical protein
MTVVEPPPQVSQDRAEVSLEDDAEGPRFGEGGDDRLAVGLFRARTPYLPDRGEKVRGGTAGELASRGERDAAA